MKLRRFGVHGKNNEKTLTKRDIDHQRLYRRNIGKRKYLPNELLLFRRLRDPDTPPCRTWCRCPPQTWWWTWSPGASSGASWSRPCWCSAPSSSPSGSWIRSSSSGNETHVSSRLCMVSPQLLSKETVSPDCSPNRDKEITSGRDWSGVVSQA